MKNQHDTPPDAEDPAAEKGHRLGILRHRVMGTLGSLLFLLPLAFIFDLVGYVPDFMRLLAIYLLLALPLCRYPRAAALRGGGVLVVAMLVNALTPLPPAAEIFLLTFVHLWVWSLSGQVSGRLAQGIAFYTLLHLFLFVSPLGYNLLEDLNGAVLWFGGWIAGGVLNTGYTYQNVGSFLLFLSLSVHAWDRSFISVARTAIFAAVVLLLVNGLLSAVLLFGDPSHPVVDLGPDLTWDLSFRDLLTHKELAGYLRSATLLVYPAFVFLAHAIVYLFLHHDARPAPTVSTAAEPKATPVRSSRRGLAFGGLAIGLLILLTPPTTLRPTGTSKVFFLKRGVVSFTKPDYNRYSRAAGGMFGFVPDYAGLFGCDAEVVDEVPDPLEPGQVLVITNIDEPFTPEETERIWSFVRAGGGLWVLGDHTFIKNGRNHVNDLLEPTHIRLNHDSAQFYPQGWFNSFRLRQGTPFGSLRHPAENRLSVLVGSSLDLQPPARPFIMGRFGYGDLGPEEEDEERGWLGDFEYQTTERLGDLVLVAGEYVGAGKVLVFGDTTSFFNLNLVRSYELLRSILTWFGEPQAYAWFFSRAAGLLAVLLLGLTLMVSVRSHALRPSLQTLCGLAVLSFIGHQAAGLAFDRQVARGRMAVIDFSQQPFASKHANMGSGLFGVTASFFRHGMMPVTQNHWDRELMDNARLLYLNAPQRPFSSVRRRDLMAFMERGGAVVMACGYPHYANARSLLEPLGLEVRNIPLGRSFDRQAFGRPIHLFSAWPIEVNRSDATVLAMSGEWPLIVEVPVGQGRLVLIPDSQFFHNANLENLERHSQANVDFFRSLLDRVRGGVTTP